MKHHEHFDHEHFEHHHEPLPPPPVVVTPPPVVVVPPVVVPPVVTVTPPAPTAVLDTTLASIGHEYQNAVSELLAGNSAASTDLAQTAYDLLHVTSNTTGVYGLAEQDVWFPAHGSGSPEALTFGFQEVVNEINALAQTGNTATAVNGLLWDIGQITSGPGVSSMLFNGAGAVDATGLFTTPTATAPSPILIEETAAEWNFANNAVNGATAVLNSVFGDLPNHLAYTITQIQGFEAYIKGSVPDAAFGATFAADLSHVETAVTAMLGAVEDIAAHGMGGPTAAIPNPNLAHDQAIFSTAGAMLINAPADMLSHSMPPPNFWLHA